MPAFIDLAGKKFGYLKVIHRVGIAVSGNATWLCKCICGTEKIIMSSNLRHGNTRSCGCQKLNLNHEKSIKHGHAKKGRHTSTYQTWCKMIERTTNPNNDRWKDYGGRGIKMCKRWRNSFQKFLTDMGEKPSSKHSIDRIDVNGDYTPENCRWATLKQQANNTRQNAYIEIDGIKKTIKQWCDFYGTKYYIATWRLKNGWPTKRAFTEPIDPHRKKRTYGR